MQERDLAPVRPRRVVPTRWLVLVMLGAACAGSGIAGDPFFARWETFDSSRGLPGDRVTAVRVDGSRVWAGTEHGLALLSKDGVRVFGTADGLPYPVISALAVDPRTGDLWIGTLGGLARWSGGRIDSFTQLDSGLANDVVYGVAADATGVWAATAAGLSHYDAANDHWEIFDTSNSLMHEPWTYSVTTARETVYVAVWGGGVIVRGKDEKRFREHRDPDGEMEIDLFRDDGLVHDVTSSVAVDGGVMWVGTYFGLSRYDGRRWQSYSESDSGLASDFINFVAARDGVVWIATDRGISRFDSRTWHTWRWRDGGGFEYFVREADGRESRRGPATGPASHVVFGLDLDGNDLWLATAAGLSHGIAKQRTGAPPTGGDAPEEGDRP